MSLRPYSEYKASGVDWLGDIPTHWDVEKVKRIFQHKKELNRSGKNTNVLSLTLRGVVNNNPDNPEGLVPKDYATYQVFEKDNLVFKLIDLENLKTSRVGLVHENGIMSSAYVRLILQTSNNIRYFYHQFYDLYLRGVYNNLGAGVRSTLGQNDLLNLQIIISPPDEQEAIVTFLDTAEKRIRRYIRAKQKLIKLLNEQKQAIIQQAVTQGLDPDVPMKDSGVEWLGEIPSHWEVRSFCRLAQIIRGASPRPAGDSRYFYGSFIPWVTVGEITKDDEIYLLETDTYLTELGSNHSRIMTKDSLVITNSGATLGVPKILAMDVCANDGVVAFNKLSDDIDSIFGYYYLTSLTRRLRDELKQGGTQPNLNTDLIKAISCPLPPAHEQKSIIDYLEDTLEGIKSTSNQAKRSIEFICEYRTRLIADVVTGKIDVRGLAFEMPEAFNEDERLDVDEDERLEEDELEEVSDGED